MTPFCIASPKRAMKPTAEEMLKVIRQQGYQQSGLTEIAEGEEQQQEHHGEGHRHDQREPAEGPVLILKLSAPGITEIPVVVEHIVPYRTVGLGHEGGEVPVPEIDLYGGHTAVHLPGYHAGSYGSTHIGHGCERDLGPGSRGEHEGAYLLGRIPGLLGVTHAGSYGSAYICHGRERNLGPGSRGEPWPRKPR